jgi:hypothetical protein
MSRENQKRKFFKPPKPVDAMSDDELTSFARLIFESISAHDEEIRDESR